MTCGRFVLTLVTCSWMTAFVSVPSAQADVVTITNAAVFPTPHVLEMFEAGPLDGVMIGGSFGSLLRTPFGYSFYTDDLDDSIRLRFDAPITAFGMDWRWVLVDEEDADQQEIQATLFDGLTEVGAGDFVPEDLNGPFWGLVSDRPFTEVVVKEGLSFLNSCGVPTITTCTVRLDVDNLRYVPSVATVPEPASLSLTAIGFGLLAVAGRRRHRL
jgi:hypothetical protein